MKDDPAKYTDGLHYGGRIDEAECRRLVAIGIARGWITPPGALRWAAPPRNKLLKVLMQEQEQEQTPVEVKRF